MKYSFLPCGLNELYFWAEGVFFYRNDEFCGELGMPGLFTLPFFLKWSLLWNGHWLIWQECQLWAFHPSMTQLIKAVLSFILKSQSWSWIGLFTQSVHVERLENDSQGRVGTDCLVLYTGAEFVLIPVSDRDYTTCQHVAVGGHCCPFWCAEQKIRTILNSFHDIVIHTVYHLRAN